MHPLPHMLTGALIGQLAANPVAAAAGGLVSHLVLDALPHTEGRTFKAGEGQTAHLFSPEMIEAALELAAGALIMGCLVSRCAGAQIVPVGLGTLGALLPDLVDQPLNRLFQISVLHIRGLHWTVTRRHALWGILTQLAVTAAAGVVLWTAAGCG